MDSPPLALRCRALNIKAGAGGGSKPSCQSPFFSVTNLVSSPASVHPGSDNLIKLAWLFLFSSLQTWQKLRDCCLQLVLTMKPEVCNSLVFRDLLDNTRRTVAFAFRQLNPFVSMETDLSSVVHNYDQLGVNSVNLLSVSEQL